MITNLILSLGLSCAVGLNGIKEKHNNYVEDNPTNVVYNDTNYQITLNVDELNNYTFDNLKEYINNLTLDTGGQAYLDIGTTWNYGNYSGALLRINEKYGNTYHIFSLVIQNGPSADVRIYFNDNNDGAFVDYIKDDHKLTHDLTLTIDSNYYTDFKNAIQADITANAPEPASMGNSIISAIVSGLGLISDLANEFLVGFSTLFWNTNNSTLTSFGTFALVMLGVAITMAVISLVLNLIRGNTGA